MALFVWTNARLFVNEVDLSAQMSQLLLDYKAEILDATAFQQAAIGTRIHKSGLWDVSLNHEGFLDFAEPGIDEELFDTILLSETVNVTMIPVSTGTAGVIADGDHAYFGQFAGATYTPGGTVGDLAKFTYAATSKEQLAIGRVSIDDVVAVTGVVDGTAYQFGDAVAFPGFGGAIDVPAGDRIVAMVHIVADDFTDLDMIIESDDVANFAGTPATLATQANSTGITSFFMQSDGSTPITDEYFRLRVTGFTGTSATVLGVVGVVRGR